VTTDDVAGPEKDYTASEQVRLAVKSTIQNWALDRLSRPASDIQSGLEHAGYLNWDPWGTEDFDFADPVGFRAAGRLIRWLASITEGKRSWITRDEARYARWVVERSPDIPVEMLWMIVRRYLIYRRTGQITEGIDYAVLFQVPPVIEQETDEHGNVSEIDWRSRYENAVELNHVPEFPPQYLDMEHPLTIDMEESSEGKD